MKLGKNFTILVVAFACIVVYLLSNKKPSYINEYNNKILALESKIDSLHQVNDTLTVKVYFLLDSIKKIDSKILTKDKEINKLKYEISTQINTVDSFNNMELKKFFTDRYRQCINPTTQLPCKTNN